MRIGINGSSLVAMGAPLEKIAAHASTVEKQGFPSYWLGQMASPDVLTLFATLGASTERIELGTAVVPTWTRHPLMLAAQTLTAQEATGNRVTLGIGLAHKPLVEHNLKIPFERPARHMEDYLSVLLPALQDRKVTYQGEIWSGEEDLSTTTPTATAPQVLVAAMGPRMLRLTRERAAGTILWLSGPRTVERAIAPGLGPDARIVAGLPVCVSKDPDAVRGMIAKALAGYAALPSYRAMLDVEGAVGPADVAVVGDERTVAARLRELAEAGATDFAGTEFGLTRDDFTATREVLTGLAQEG